MERLRQSINDAKKELEKRINIPPGVQEQSPMEFAEIKTLEEKLKKFISQGEKILKENFTNI